MNVSHIAHIANDVDVVGVRELVALGLQQLRSDVLVEGVLDADFITVCARSIVSSSFLGREM